MELFDLKTLILTVGYIGLFAIIFAESGLFFGFFLPGDSVIFTAGFLASQGLLDLRILIPLLAVAAISGDQVGYSFGYRVGRPLFERKGSLIFQKKHLLKAEAFFERHGGKAIVLARFLPAVRTFTPIVAGTARMRYRRFVTYNVLGGLFWAVGLSVGGYVFGSIVPDVDRYLLPVIALIVILSGLPTAIHLWRESRHDIWRWARARWRVQI
ncbi:MAG: VTT domain-containing protein [Chloroflexi bacterium]|nr:VTT domain-containing protein [Chloroflexota bacterium]